MGRVVASPNIVPGIGLADKGNMASEKSAEIVLTLSTVPAIL
jgi:hypothetical protein